MNWVYILIIPVILLLISLYFHFRLPNLETAKRNKKIKKIWEAYKRSWKRGKSSYSYDAMEILLDIVDEDSVDLFNRSLNDKNEWIKENACKILSKIRSNSSIEPLIAFLRNEAYPSYGFETLEKIGGVRTVNYLIEQLKNPCLAKCGWVSLKAAEVLQSLRISPVQINIILLTNEDSLIREKAAKSLGELKDISAVEPLILQLSDLNNFVLEEVVIALGCIGDSRAILPLINLLKNQTLHKHHVIPEALGKIKDKKVVEAIIPLLESKNINVCYEAIMTLKEIKDISALDPLIKCLLRSEDYDCIVVATDAVLDYGEPAVQTLINSLLQKDNYFNEKIVIANIFYSYYSYGWSEEGKIELEPFIQALAKNQLKLEPNEVFAYPGHHHKFAGTCNDNCGELMFYCKDIGETFHNTNIENIDFCFGGYYHKHPEIPMKYCR